MANLRNKRFLLFVAWAIATYLLYVCFKGVELEHSWEEVKRANPLWLILGILEHFSIFIFWANQWILFLPDPLKITFTRMFKINALMCTAMNTLPFPGGHAFGVFLLAKKERVGHPAALSVMSLDQLTEGIAKLTVLFIVGWFTPLPTIMKQGILGLAVIIFLLLCLLLYFAHRFQHYKSFDPKYHTTLKKKITHFISRWGHQLEGLRSLKTFFYGTILAYGMKLGEALAIWGVQKSFGINLPIWSVLLILAALNLTTLIPLAPGNLGVYEATVFFIYQHLGIAPEQALALALAQHLCFLLPLAGTGYVFILLESLTPKYSSQKQNTNKPKHILENERV